MEYIEIKNLSIVSKIGVGEDERKLPQTLALDLKISPQKNLCGINDDIAKTINYFEVANSVRDLAQCRERKLIETLCEEIGLAVLKNFSAKQVEVCVKKFIIPNSECVSIRMIFPKVAK